MGTGSYSSFAIADKCLNKGTIVHYLMKSIGLYDEFNRPDRDSYVKINYETFKMVINIKILICEMSN